VDALVKIGTAAVPSLLKCIAETDAQAPVGQPEAPWAMGEHKAKVILLCKTLDDILGDEASVKRLRDAATAEKDPARAQRLNAASDRIAKGLMPPT
jgi:hypothetical protein